ncbi:MAG TPA: ATP-binding cassette domain-containing protein, partial [bacterium]|nr:ATP-binding cassette domain-containing protein [bacterium]
MRFGDKVVLDGLNMTVCEGENYVLMGKSGCGKSVLLKCILRLLTPDSGDIFLWGKNIATLSDDEMNALKMKISYVFQDGALLSYFTVAGNVGLSLRENTNLSDEEIDRIVNEKLRWVNLEGTQNLHTSELSGGMRKRVSIARALAIEPKLIFYDEPTTGMDPPLSDTLDQLIYSLNQKLHNTSITVTHDPVAAFYFGDRFGMIHEGKMLFEGTQEQLQDCNDETVIGFITRRLHHDDPRKYFITGQRGRPGKP